MLAYYSVPNDIFEHLSLHYYDFCFVLQKSLCVLNINNNQVDDIRALSVLKELHHFSAQDNKLHSIEASINYFGLI